MKARYCLRCSYTHRPRSPSFGGARSPYYSLHSTKSWNRCSQDLTCATWNTGALCVHSHLKPHPFKRSICPASKGQTWIALVGRRHTCVELPDTRPEGWNFRHVSGPFHVPCIELFPLLGALLPRKIQVWTLKCKSNSHQEKNIVWRLF
jgi:hypothetical protein